MPRFPLSPSSPSRGYSALIDPEREHYPNIHEDPHLVFTNAKGKIRAGCYFGSSDIFTFDLGLVPDAIADRGADAVRVYAGKKMRALIKKERRREAARVKRILELHREYEVWHGDVIIRGFVKKDKDNGPRANFMKLTMTKPFQLEQIIYVSPQCWADAVAGNRTFDDNGNLTEQAVEIQEGVLIDMYKRECRRRRRSPAHPALAALRTGSRAEDDSNDEEE